LSAHNAPPVVYPLGRSRFQSSLLLGLWLAGLLLVSSWVYVVQKMDWRTVLSIFSVFAAGVATYIGTKSASAGRLCWDGDVWRWETLSYQAGTAEYNVSVVIDFQHKLLLRLQEQSQAKVWIWVERQTAPERWLDLRRALYSPHRSPVVSDSSSAEPGPAVAVSVPMRPVDTAQTNS
jgi:toxin CptA